MKPTIPEKGTVISLGDGVATVLLEGGGHCKGCGAGKIGLCRPGGKSMLLRVHNDAGARVGDVVVVGIDRKVRIRGYFLAYIIPLVSFMAGAVTGHIVGEYLDISSLDVSAGFLSFAVTSFYTFYKLRRLDRTSAMAVHRVVYDRAFDPDVKSDEEKRFEGYPGTSD